MTEIERAKLKLELKRVDTAKDEMLLRIMERTEEIEKLKENIKIQEKRIEEITNQLGE